MRKTGGVKDPVHDEAVFNWFVTKRADGVPLSGPMIQTQALKIAQELNPDAAEGSFLASKGWLHRWQRRHGVRSVQIAGEARSADSEAAEQFLPRLQALVEEEGYSPEQVFNADETALYWRCVYSSSSETYMLLPCFYHALIVCPIFIIFVYVSV